jgi:hypothetical protein
MKRDKLKNVDVEMENAGIDGAQMDDPSQIAKDIARMHEETKRAEPLFQDKMMNQLNQEIIYLPDFTEFPSFNIVSGQGKISFNHYSKHKTLMDCNESRMEYFSQRLLQAEERIFSHVDLYKRAKLAESSGESKI